MSDRSLPRPPADSLYPVAFMVEELGDATLGVHYHQSNQFQLFVSGSGTLGRQPIVPFSFHYADAYTAYGPIVAGEQGLRYLTLRNSFDPGPQYMPEFRDALRAQGAKPRQSRLTVIPGLGHASERSGPSLQRPVLEPGVDGLGVWHIAVPPGQTHRGPPPADGGGQYWVIADGSAVVDGETFGPLACFFVGPSEDGPTVMATDQGAEIILLQFPRARSPRS